MYPQTLNFFSSMGVIKETQKIIVRGRSIETHSTEGRLVGLVNKAAQERDYRPFFDLLEEASDKSVIYRIAAYVLIDISYLRGTGGFDELRLRIVERLRSSRYERCELEIKLAAQWRDCSMEDGDRRAAFEAFKEQARDAVQVESNLIFVLALLSFLDTKNDYPGYLTKTARSAKRISYSLLRFKSLTDRWGLD
jgi:hypothetical protein